MPLPTLEKLRKQCRIDGGNDLDDDLLLTYRGAAKKRAENYLNRTLYEDEIPEIDPDGLMISDDIELAIMLTVGYWYENREAQSLPTGFKALLEPYRFIPL
ncbi:head-tail connector protein [Xenorhabdus griffiniae]|uniref:Head-tail connector protein n=1 Tax=Xenorhabdus griffiniae TaxID=351672 RepID=A0ABY9XDG8_9GAMM|nr:head-tail connector protein [Xenorhabdus griffiniae]MBD1229126.1 phage gp6-like head-tail connector protein [Xenorhabdus griffiniae]MBE8588943.1 phage gp6-like head-tail connector protein [Xenorhabdus griffiniae]WMV70962.1 head-tail connector protein [Xenorhabdus griffiniae]WMV71661.1 head-tail connector protein [Xenorhabdus griffiniae]WNH00638.1 head-tail connector protein [Xenorhabdus griffiniae]